MMALSIELECEIWIRMYFSTIRPQILKINFSLRVQTFHASVALVTKFRAIRELVYSPVVRFELAQHRTDVRCGLPAKVIVAHVCGGTVPKFYEIPRITGKVYDLRGGLLGRLQQHDLVW